MLNSNTFIGLHSKCECRRCFKLQHLSPVVYAVGLFLGSGRDVLYQRLLRLALWETSSSCSSSQLSTWFMEMWAISRLAPQSSPDELGPSAHVTTLCFLHWPIFIQTDKLNLPCFRGSYFPAHIPFFHIWLLANYWRWDIDVKELPSQISQLLGTCLFPPHGSDMGNTQTSNRGMVS